MVIHRPKTAMEATKLRHEIENSAYLAGGTEDLRLGSSVSSDAELIDINALSLNDIFIKDDRLYIGACATLEDVVTSDIIPSFIREAASFCTSYERRNAATIGGNVATRREDSYMTAALVASECHVILECHKGEKEKSLVEYLEKKHCKGLLKYFIIDKSRQGWVKRIARSSSSHSTLIASHSASVYALSASGSHFEFGDTPDLYKKMEFKDDLTGSAEYKKYLASVIFSLEGK